MKAINYVLEIYEPGSASEILCSFESRDPFIPISRDSVLNPSQWTDKYCGRILRVSKVEHGISQTNDITHTLMIYSEFAEDAGDGTWWEAWSDLKGRVLDARDRARAAAVSLMEQYEPMIRETLTERIGQVANERIQDEQAMRDLLERAYEVIPGYIKVAVRRERFVEWGLQNRFRLMNVPTAPPTRDKAFPKKKSPKKKGLARKTTTSKAKAVRRKTSRQRTRKPARRA